VSFLTHGVFIYFDTIPVFQEGKQTERQINRQNYYFNIALYMTVVLTAMQHPYNYGEGDAQLAM